MSIKLTYIRPHHLLAPYISKMWLFESPGKMPHHDMKLVVPNGMVKLVIPVCNGIIGSYKDWSLHSKESAITIIGLADSPAIVDLEHDAPHKNIGIEFSPMGAYRIFHVRYVELKNRIHLLEDVVGKTARRLQEEVVNYATVEEKVHAVQQFLLALLSKSAPDTILDYCLGRLKASNGRITVGELEKKTGFSSRWLHEKFMEKVGLSPKGLSSVLRFMQFYEAWAK